VKELTRASLYNYLLVEQRKIQSALDEDDEGPNSEIRRGARAMAPRIIKGCTLGRESNEAHFAIKSVHSNDGALVDAIFEIVKSQHGY
jgi:hypothetical protein